MWRKPDAELSCPFQFHPWISEIASRTLESGLLLPFSALSSLFPDLSSACERCGLGQVTEASTGSPDRIVSKEKPQSLLYPEASIKDSHKRMSSTLRIARSIWGKRKKMAYEGQTEVEDKTKIQNLHPGRARVDCSTLLVTREMQSKVTVRHHVISSSLTIMFFTNGK